MNTEEKLAFAQKIRHGKRSEPVPQALLEAIPATEETLAIPTREGDCRAYWIRANHAPEPCAVILNFHGGGFVKGRLDRDSLFCRHLAAALNCAVLDVDYSLAPERPYPTAAHEAEDVARWLYQNAERLAVDPDRVAMVGHSAGATMVMYALKALAGEPYQPTCAVLDYGPYDFVKASTEKPKYPKALPVQLLEAFNDCYRDPEQGVSASPLFYPDAVLSHFPDCLFVEAGQDSLNEEGFQMAGRLSRLGPEVTVRCYTDCAHGFLINRIERWQEATSYVQHYLARKLGCTLQTVAGTYELTHEEKELFL